MRIVTDLLAMQLRQRPDHPALGIFHEGEYQWLSWARLTDDVLVCADALQRLGVERRERVAQAAANDYPWIVVDLATLLVGGVHVPLQPTLPNEEINRQLDYCGARWAVGRGTAAHDATFDAETSKGGPRRLPWITPADLAIPASPTAMRPLAYEAEEAAQRLARCPAEPDDVATILFTSGTSGACRAVALTHANLISNVEALTSAMAPLDEETRLLILPLSHIYARTCDLYVWLHSGTRMALATSRENILSDCNLVQPTALNGVPYFYQKIADKVGSAPPVQRSAFLRQALGGKIQRCFCGGAQVAPAVETLFLEAGLPLLSGYGLSEASPVVTAATPETYEPGTVGRPLANLTVRLADDGEILVRGPSVMPGYWEAPEANAVTLAEGWLHTGDVGVFTDRGNLRIVGRKKELVALSTGKNVWLADIEALLVGSPLIEQACVIGDGRPYLTAILVPQPDALRAAMRAERIRVWTRRGVLRNARVEQLYRREIDRLLAHAAPHEQLGGFWLIDRMFDASRGETTAKLSLRRDVIAKNFAQEIEEVYRSPGILPGTRR